ncbi:hypothetical protein O1611_g3887 [Lasiodiplodia mahajangana]|uniref:Uncharacterized protein n=1 Tax=Lasiodiplodia mahajangana TaxID=1108764 RepID=A0ACC2JQG5_9PEZI|nr:hypothetical protein O1611_g3887 [Lasiodiplodia mahajangana]
MNLHWDGGGSGRRVPSPLKRTYDVIEDDTSDSGSPPKRLPTSTSVGFTYTQTSSPHSTVYHDLPNQISQQHRGEQLRPQLQVERPLFDTCLGLIQLESVQVRPGYINTSETHVKLDPRANLVILRHPHLNQYIGMIEGVNAAIIATLLTTGKVGLFATIQHPNYLKVLAYASRSDCEEIGDLLFAHDCFLQQPEAYDQTTTYYNPQLLTRPGQELDFPHTETPSLSPRNHSLSSLEKDKVNQLFESAVVPTTFTEAEVSPLLNTKLKEHQLKALSMMFEKESGILAGSEFPALWTEMQNQCSSAPMYYNTVSETKHTSRPSLCRGGLLADEMGLGKTLTILALIAGSLDRDDPRVGPGPHPTLIVAPLSTLPNWEDQIRRHFKFESIQFTTYQGPLRRKKNTSLGENDIVLTTYDTMRADYSVLFPESNNKGKKRKSSDGMLHNILWKRVVLDEAHIIRNRNSRVFIAACKLKAQHRWCVSGTPIQNSIEDLGALIEFLRVSPFDTPSAFRRFSSYPAGGRDSMFWDRLKRLVQCTSLRRTKESIGASLKLPPRREIEHPVDLTSEERRIYDLTKRHFSTSLDSGKSSVNAFNLLLRLRQVCNHGRDLLPKSLQGWLDQAFQYMDPITPPLGLTCEACEALIFDERLICGSLPCLHQICKSCFGVGDIDEGITPTCPLCKNSSSKPRSSGSGDSARADSVSSSPLEYIPSSKVEALIKNLRDDNEEQRRQGNTPPKSLVFSEWTSMLDLIGNALTMNKFIFRRLDGSLSLTQRRQVLSEFRDDQRCTVLLATLRCAGVGSNSLDLTMASRVHLIEPGWNPMLEQQALDRVHRLGQTKEVASIRYIVQGSDSIEKYIQKVQVSKNEMITSSLDGSNSDRTQIIKDILHDFRETVDFET